MSKVKPVIIKKHKIRTLKSLSNIVQEDIIFRATPNDFLKGKYPNLVISNKLNKLNNSSQTIASFTSNNSSVVELTSDAVSQLIGQKNYASVLAALCSVINQDLKIKALLSLLTTKEIANNVTISAPKLIKNNVAIQTEESCMKLLMKEKQRRNRRSRTVKPYVVTDQLTKVIIHPNQLKKELSIHKNQETQENWEQKLPNLELIDIDLSNASWGSLSNLSILSDSIPNKVLDPYFMLNTIDKHTEDTLAVHDTSNNPENQYDATAETVLSNVAHPLSEKVMINDDSFSGMSLEEKQKFIIQQAIADFKFCIQQDEDDNLPIHQAVIRDDVSMLKRNCIMLNKRGKSVDELSGNNFTALQMSIFHNSVNCMEILLQFGADMFVTDDESRTCFHLAAEKDTDHLKLLVEHCKKDASVWQNEILWNAFCECQSNEGINQFLLRFISTLYDSQGYTPFMLASKSGVAKNVKLLVEISPNTINMAMPNCGNTALYLAVAAACLDADEREDKSTISENYLQTVETLIVNGGDPFLQNSSGNNVNGLLSDGNPMAGRLIKLSQLIANKLTSVKYFGGNSVKNLEKFMLVRNLQGDISIADVQNHTLEKGRKGKKANTMMSQSVSSDEYTSAGLPTNVETYVVDSSIKNNNRGTQISSGSSDKPTILHNISIVNVSQATAAPSKKCIDKKNKTVVTSPFILKKNKVNKSKCDVNLKTNVGNMFAFKSNRPIKIVKILSETEPGIKIVRNTKILNPETQPTTSKRIKTNFENT